VETDIDAFAMSAPQSPFVGLAAFTPRMAVYFTGRERFALTLAGAVLRSRITVLYGQSGSGKSSVLGAALPQALRATLKRAAETTQRVPFRLLNFRRWHPGFETRLYRAAAAKLAPTAKLESLRDSSLVTAIARWERGHEHKAPVILVLDQFEEFLLYHAKPSETSFGQDLATVVANLDIEARVLLSLREDSLANLDALRAVIPGILSSPVQLRPLDRTAAEQAIRRPVAKWSEDKFGDPKAIVVEDSLVDTLLNQVQQTGATSLSTQTTPNSTASLVELPLLQLTLERLWEEEAKAEKPALRLPKLEQLGGASGIARRHLDQTLEALPAPQRRLAIRLFRHLVTATGGKHAWRADDLAEEIEADTQAARQAAERTIFGRMTDRIKRVAGAVAAAGRSRFGAEKASVSAETTKAAVTETLDKLAQGRARILRTQPDPRGQGPLFELYHDALAHPVLSWVQEARIKEAERHQRRRFWGAVGAALLMFAVSLVVYTFYQRAVLQQAQAELQKTRAVSTLARQATERGDAMTGMLATLTVLPGNLAKADLPLINAASAALLDAWLRNREKLDLLGHTGEVTSVAFSPDGKRVVTGSFDHTARVWDLSGGPPAATVLGGDGGRVWSVAFGPDGKRVATGSDDGMARVWDLSEPTRPPTRLKGHGGIVNSVAFSPDGMRVAIGSGDPTALVWDLSEPTHAPTRLEGHQGGVWSVAFSPDGKRVVTGSADHTALVWDLSRATPAPAAPPLKGHDGAIRSVAFSSDGMRVVTGSYDNTARVWDLSGATPTATVLPGHRGTVTSAAFSPDGMRVVTGSADHTARVWDLSGPCPAATVLAGHRGWVNSVAFSPDGERLVTGSSDSTARLWDWPGPTHAATKLDAHLDEFGSVAFSPDGKRLVTGSSYGVARMWDLSGPTPTSTPLEDYDRGVNSVAFSPDGKRVATGSDDGAALLWDLSGARPTPIPLERHGGRFWKLAFSPDGKWVVAGSGDGNDGGTAGVWDVSGPTPAAIPLEGHHGDVWSVAFSPDGKVATGSRDGMARVWDLPRPTPAATLFAVYPGGVNNVAFSPDGKRVAIGSGARTALVWDWSGPTPATELKGHSQGIWSVAFSPDGERVVTGSSDHTARVWDLSRATPAATPLEGHLDEIRSVAFSPDGKLVATGSEDGTARVWDLSGPTPAATVLEGHQGPVRSVAFSPDAKRVVTASKDGTARVWETPPLEELSRLARAALTRCLTIAQRDELGLPVLPGAGQDRERVDPPPCP
jgi:WD40 repeat protein